jgi:hypothetical protein
MARQPLFPDTDEKTKQVLLELVRAMPDWKKLEQIADLTNTVRELAMIELRERYPDAQEEELRFRFASLILGRDIAMRVYGRFPESEASR